MKVIKKSELIGLVMSGALVRVGRYMDSIADYRSGRNENGPWEVKHVASLVKFGEDQAIEVLTPLESEASVKLYNSSPRPFQLGDKVVAVLTEMGRNRKTFKPEARGELFAFDEKA